MNDDKNEMTSVRITDIDMPFMSMVNFLAKLVLAAIPAMIVAAIIVTGLFMVISAIFHR